MGCASGYLRLLHTLIALAGLALVGTSIYLLATGQQFFPDTSGQYAWTAWAPLVFGLLVFGLATCGCCCESISKNKCFICIFAILQFVFGIVTIAAGAALIVLSVEYMPAIAAAPQATEGLSDGFAGLQQETSDFFLGLYDGCCGVTSLNNCPNFTPSDGGAFQYCFKSADVYNAGVQSGAASRQQYCTIGSLPSTCPGGGGLQINAFLKENSNLLTQGVLPSGIALTVFGVLLMLAFIASCTLMCCSSESSSKPPPPQYRTAGDTAGTGRPGDNIQYA